MIEHLPYPEKIINLISSVIDKGGFLIIDTPNGDSKNIIMKRDNWEGFNPYHIYIFTVNNLKKLLNDNGFIIDKVFFYRKLNILLNNNIKIHFIKNYFRLFFQKIGLFNQVQHLYHSLIYLLDKIKGKENYLMEAVKISQDCSNIWKNIEITDKYYGDNLVIIAKKY